MKLTDLKKILFSTYGESLKPLGFKKEKYGFRKNEGNFSYFFNFSSIDRDNSYPTEFSYSLSVKSLARILSNVIYFNGEYYQVTGGSQVNLFEMKKYPIKDYDIYTESDALSMAKEVLTYFINETLPYLKSISSLETLETLVNKAPHPLSFRSGLVLAKLVDNPQYDSLVEQYRESFKGWVVEWDKTDFEKIVAFLDCHSLDELHAMAE